jgi:hypothetical protein
MGVEDVLRPTRQAEYGVPGGHMLIHYDTTGPHRVWQANIDSDGDGVPDYVEALAMIADSCYDHIATTLGYQLPPVDSICLDGGDYRIDIYIDSMPVGYYGETNNQTECYPLQPMQAASWITIDRDFQQLPPYVGRPLDAARVTIAHELFHVFHFGMDATEHITWFEMSAVWMEEEIYDEVNDYHLYDYIFFNSPRRALNDTFPDNHMYQAAVFPIFVSEKYGPDAIRRVWEHAASLGPGSDFLEGFDNVIDSAGRDPANGRYECVCWNPDSSVCLEQVYHTDDFATSMVEFAMWNYFTGPYADWAPDGFGYSEAAQYAQIPLDSMDVQDTYPMRVLRNGNTFAPRHNGALYTRWENLQSIENDTFMTAWLQVSDEPTIPPIRWGVGGIFQLEQYPDSHVVVWDAVDVWETPRCIEWECTDSTGGECVDSACITWGVPWELRYVDDLLGEWICTDGTFGHDGWCNSTCLDSTQAVDLRDFRSITLVVTPSVISTAPDSSSDLLGVGYVLNDTSFINMSLVNLPASVMTPYPNPAVMSELAGEPLTFRFRSPTDTTSFAVSRVAFMQLDIFNVAGELVRSLEVDFDSQGRGELLPGGVIEAEWDLKNQGGKEVASGVYIAVARLFDGAELGNLLVEDKVKVAVIR